MPPLDREQITAMGEIVTSVDSDELDADEPPMIEVRPGEEVTEKNVLQGLEAFVSHLRAEDKDEYVPSGLEVSEVQTVVVDDNLAESVLRTFALHRRRAEHGFDPKRLPNIDWQPEMDLTVEDDRPVTLLFQGDFKYEIYAELIVYVRAGVNHKRKTYTFTATDSERPSFEVDSDSGISTGELAGAKIKWFAEGRAYPLLKLGYEVFGERKIERFRRGAYARIQNGQDSVFEWQDGTE